MMADTDTEVLTPADLARALLSLKRKPKDEDDEEESIDGLTV